MASPWMPGIGLFGVYTTILLCHTFHKKHLKISYVNCLVSQDQKTRYKFKEIRYVCTKILDEKFQDASVEEIAEGNTNTMFIASIEDRKVIVRVYGENSDMLFNREEEDRIFRMLSDKQFGPKLYGAFQNGRVEEYLLNSESITTQHLSQTEPINFPLMIARELRRMHCLVLDLDKTPRIWEMIDRFKILCEETIAASTKPMGIDMKAANDAIYDLMQHIASPLNFEGIRLLESCESEAEKYAMQFCFEPVFCHNDLVYGNILYFRDQGSVRFIDFEYAHYNYRGFDLGNHFCEYAGFAVDMVNKYPSLESQTAFLREYMDTCRDTLVDTIRAKMALNRDFEKAFFRHAYKYIYYYTRASHLLWGLWAVVQEQHSDQPFGFLDYAKLRLKALAEHKLPNDIN